MRKSKFSFSKTNPLLHRHSPHEKDSPLLRVSHLYVSYDHVVVLEDISFELKAGDRLAVVGPNGAGKSTLFKVIAGVLPPTSGEVDIYGHTPGGHICIAYVPQRSVVDWKFPVTVAEVVMMGRIGKLGLLRQPSPKDWGIVQRALETVNLNDLTHQPIGQLSGGQQQRMFIARALAQEAELVLMDEPLTGLDINAQEDIFHILDMLRQQGIAVMVALHDLKIAAAHFEGVLLLNHRLIGFGNPGEVFNTPTLLRAYRNLHFIQDQKGLLVMEDTCCEGEEEQHG